MSYKLIFLLPLVIFVITSSDVEAAKGTVSPLDQFLQYRAEHGKDTARQDMLDNGVIDNSINSVEFIEPEPELVPDKKSVDNLVIQRAVPEDVSEFVYHWEQNASVSGSEYSSYINKPLKVTFLDNKITTPDNSASEKLLDRYGILLSNEKISWNLEHSYALLETMGTIPQKTRDHSSVTSKWILSNEHIDNDIRITKMESHIVVEISLDVFEHSTPKIAQIDDKMGKYFSQRLHHAMVWYVTDEGNDLDAIERILGERFGISTRVPNYKELTQYTTDESESSFQKFHPLELIEIINMFEEMPKGFHSIDGLDYIIRRADGTSHPSHPSAPAVGWPSVNPGYIEFMESAFTVDDDFLHRLIIHEKSHFLWGHLFSDGLKNDWIKLGGWYESSTAFGWSTKKTTEFVSAYSHLKNPDEDMAESISYFVIDPDKLKSRSLPKYEFVRDRIMEGNIYIPTVREDLTFEVFNLYPDYIYPGKIIRVDIFIDGDEHEDKHAKIEIELSGKTQFDGAKNAYLRLLSDIGTYVDVTLFPIDGSLGHILKGEITISANAKSGLWKTNQIIVTDQTGNQRFEGQNDFGWKFFINNVNEDTTPPQYVKNSLKLTKRSEYESYQRLIQIVTASWRVFENQETKVCHATIDQEDLASYSIDAYGVFDSKNVTCIVDFKITEYFRSGDYTIRQLRMSDEAGNNGITDFTKLAEDHSIFVRTINPDVDYPRLDINNIRISAEPTNPIEPNGETNIKIVYYAKDDKSGLGPVSYILRDPQGIQHSFYHYHKNFHGLFFDGKPEELIRYDINLVLPEGSPPGKWALVQMNLADKANNAKSHEFTEIIHFEVI
jgi:hypothetical protein